ncbi:MAG TPA: nucleoside triphosphate pyrophosphohydrolase [Ktedonobacterales bacterium]|nr:nucleoside triphosphate pyrophosphohydrolase [Ktedonobacterales bacterium]
MAGEQGVIVVGLGPGRWEDLTIEARDVLAATDRVVCRTLRHPTVDALRERRPDLTLDSFDALYENAASFAELYPEMVRRIFTLAASQPREQPLVYAVPGHPLIAEASVRELRRQAPEHGVSVRIVAGLSFVEPVCAALDLDPLERDMQLIDATLLADSAPDALMGNLLPTRPILIAQAYNRRIASGVKLALGEVYPDDWEVSVVRWASLPGAETVQRVPLMDLDRGEHADHLTTLYVPPLDPLQAVRVPEGLRYITARLRAPNGCPWDREQTHQSLRKYVLEEAYEVAEVLDDWDGSPELAEKLAEELGDLLLQVYLQAEIANEEDFFHLGDVYQAVSEKLIRRHPHVFGEVTVRDAAHVIRNWEAIKREERAANGEDVRQESRLRGVPKSAPALYQAYELGRKAAKVGFVWPDVAGVLSKITEEARELAEAIESGDKVEQSAELGDLLFVLARLADSLGVQPEDALHTANRRFRRRFEAMEEQMRDRGRSLESLSLDDWLSLWADAKATVG